MRVQIHIYNSNDALLDDLLASKYISELETMSFDKYKNLETKKEKVVSSIFKNKYIGTYHLNEFGKPVSDSKFFNISHSHGLVAFVMDDYPIGVDIERIRPAKEDLIEYISSEDEKKYIHDDESFFEIWTNKEALVKCIGTGIKVKPRDIVGLPINGPRTYNGVTFYNKTVKYLDSVITVSRQINEDFDIEVIKEII